MVNVVTERPISLDEAAAFLPGSKGKRLSYGTVYRWVSKGHRGVRLEASPLGGRWITSVEALQRFMEALAARQEQQPQGSRSDSDSRRALREQHGI